MGIVAIGMTCVLLTGGIDLSVGSAMFLVAVIAGKLAIAGYSLWLVLPLVLLVGVFWGWLNAVFIVRLRVLAFMVTLAMLYVGRGLGLLISQTRAMNLPESFLELANARFWGLPLPVLVFGMVVLVSHTVLTRTAFGRQVYAVGSDREAAEKAGIHTGFVLTGVYVICALYAAGGGIIAVAQIGAVTPGFGEQREFLAIAAAVLGGTSVFGGRGAVFPGTVLGAILIQAIENGLVLINADPYIYPLITSAVIFLAVAVDSFRHGFLQQLTRRRIRLEAEA